MYQNQKKKVELCTKTFGLYQVSQRFQYSQIENIKTLLSKYRFFFFLILKSSTIYWDAMLLALISHLSFFKLFAFFKFNMHFIRVTKKVTVIRLKIKTICLAKKLFWIVIKVTVLIINFNNQELIHRIDCFWYIICYQSKAMKFFSFHKFLFYDL